MVESLWSWRFGGFRFAAVGVVRFCILGLGLGLTSGSKVVGLYD